MLNKIFENITLMKSLGLHHFKMETEAEGLTVSDMLARMAIMRHTETPVWVKIGGCEAISDIKTCLGMGVDGITAPMVESEFAARKFREAIDTVYRGFKQPEASINIETFTAAKIARTLACWCFSYRLKLTIGQSDLAKCLCAEKQYLPRYVKKISIEAKVRGVPFSIGGGITPKNVNQIIEDYQPDYVNTRNWCFDVVGVQKSERHCTCVGIDGKFQHSTCYELSAKEPVSRKMEEAITLALETEILMLKYFNQPNNKRIKEIEKRLSDDKLGIKKTIAVKGQSVKITELSPRAYMALDRFSCLERIDADTVIITRDVQRSDISRCRNVGKKTIDEIEKNFAELGGRVSDE